MDTRQAWLSKPSLVREAIMLPVATVYHAVFYVDESECVQKTAQVLWLTRLQAAEPFLVAPCPCLYSFELVLTACVTA